MHLLIIFAAKYLIAVPVLVWIVCLLFSRGKTLVQFLWLTVLSLPVAFILSRVAGLFYYDARPFVEGNFTPLVAHAADNGFPSDHTLLAATLAMILLYVDKRAGILLLIIAIIIGLARVAAGVHHISDIVAAIVISAAAVFVSQLALSFLRKK